MNSTNSSPPRLVIVMDPIGSIKPAKDTTLAMMLAAQQRGWTLWYAEQSDLWLRDGIAMARVRDVKVKNDLKDWYQLGEMQTIKLGEADAILMRKDPPFDMEFIYTTYILERAQDQGALVVNRPQGLRDMNEKVFTAWFPQCCAPTLITRDMKDMHAFLQEHQRIVCKPLYGMGGRSIFVIDRGEKNTNVIFETMTQYGTNFAIVQKYVPEIVTTGDSRVLVIDGEPAPYALARIPSETDNRGNLAAGAKGVGRELTDRDRWLVSQIGPTLRDRGMLFVGLDVIGGFVTEINVTSPTGVRELDKQFGTNIADLLMEAVARRLVMK
ncbi:MAG TPA: glutathione synthase [Steroidobacteraceae bacterium]|nr:glutathione synthase [Steroidobacteraceae bacterium]